MAAQKQPFTESQILNDIWSEIDSETLRNPGLFFAHFLKTQDEKNSQNLKTQHDISKNSALFFQILRFPATPVIFFSCHHQN